MPVVEAIDQERALLQQQIDKTTIKQFVGIFGAISGLVLLVVVVIKRNQHALKKSSKMHQEFASSLLDMLGPDVEKNYKLDVAVNIVEINCLRETVRGIGSLLNTGRMSGP